MKALGVVADEKPAHGKSVVSRASDNSEYVDDGQMPQKMIGRVIENIADRILRTAHDALHPINRAQVMAAVYAFSPSGAHKNILVGTGGRESIYRSHYLGAVYGMERIMGRAENPVRNVLNYASDHFLRSEERRVGKE